MHVNMYGLVVTGDCYFTYAVGCVRQHIHICLSACPARASTFIKNYAQSVLIFSGGNGNPKDFVPLELRLAISEL